MRQQTGARTTALDRTRRQRGLCEAVAAGTSHARSHDTVHDEPPRHVFRLFGYIFAQTPDQKGQCFRVIRPAYPHPVTTRDVDLHLARRRCGIAGGFAIVVHRRIDDLDGKETGCIRLNKKLRCLARDAAAV